MQCNSLIENKVFQSGSKSAAGPLCACLHIMADLPHSLTSTRDKRSVLPLIASSTAADNFSSFSDSLASYFFSHWPVTDDVTPAHAH